MPALHTQDWTTSGQAGAPQVTIVPASGHAATSAVRWTGPRHGRKLPRVHDQGEDPRPSRGAVREIYTVDQATKLSYSPDLDGMADPGEIV
jgi:hypothetical protein